LKSFLIRNIPDETMQQLKIICVKKNLPINSVMLQLIDRLISEERDQELQTDNKPED